MSVTRFRLAVSLAALLGLAGCATRPVNPPITHVDPNAGYTFQTRQKHFKSQENLVVLAFSGGGTRAAAFSYGVLEFLRRTEVTTPNGQGPPARRRRCHHRRVGRQLHRIGLRSLRRQAVRRLRAALPQAQRPGRAPRPHHQSGLLGRPVVDGLGSLRTGGPALRRDPVQRCDLRRPRPRRRSVHHGVGHRHLDWRPGGLPAEHIQRTVLGSQCRAAVPRRCGIVCRARGALRRHDQQLRRHLQLRRSGLGQDVYPVRESAAAGGARDTRAEGSRDLHRQRPSPVHPSRGRRRVRQRGHARRARCAADPRSLARRGPADTARPRAQDHRLRRQLAVVASHQLGSNRRRRPARWTSC